MAYGRVQYLVQQYTSGRISASEHTELLKILEEVNVSGLAEDLTGWIDQQSETWLSKDQLPLDNDRLLATVFEVDRVNTQTKVFTPDFSSPVNRMHIIRTRFFRYAAILVLILGVGAYFLNPATKKTIVSKGSSLQTNVAPGRDKAILTLADGSTIMLDSAANGQLASQGGAQVVKLSDGKIAYDLRGPGSKETLLNTMRTPNGGQYQVTLPDGTKVWLNAASSITYPTAFTEKKRMVKITGEVYFEVATNKEKPFIIDVDGKPGVQVLGTSLNINAYADEENIKTTLLEGSIEVIHNGQSALLKPGQQAAIAVNATLASSKSVAAIPVVSGIDMDQCIAWKNGIFNFNGSDLPSVMRQLERWYDIKVHYQHSIPAVVFKGKMYRTASFSDVLFMLKRMGIEFEFSGKTLIVFKGKVFFGKLYINTKQKPKEFRPLSANVWATKNVIVSGRLL